MSVSWPGLVLSCLLGSFIGGVAGFFTARTLRDVAALQAMGVGGFVLGQLGQLVWQAPWLRVGTVDLLWGGATAGVLVWWWARRHRAIVK